MAKISDVSNAWHRFNHVLAVGGHRRTVLTRVHTRRIKRATRPPTSAELAKLRRG